jgi:hypothetical protein
MDEIDFTHILDQGDGPEPTSDVLSRIVIRHHRRRARRYQVLATTAVVVALAGVGIGLKLNNSGPSTGSALNEKPPAGLNWVVPSTGSEHGSTAESTQGSINDMADPQPGVFGLGSSGHSISPITIGPTVPGGTSSTAVNSLVGPVSPPACKVNGCNVLYDGGTPLVLFERHVDGLTVTVSRVLYAYPVSAAAIGPIKASPVPATASNTPASPPTPGTTPSTIPRRSVLPAVTTCPPPSELLVKVSGGGANETLYVPTGGTSAHPFSVVASATTGISGGRSLVLAVARTSQSVSSVSANFPGGGSDSMAPTDGWVVLVQPLSPGTSPSKADVVTLVAKSESGHVLETARLPETGALATAPVVAVCHVLLVPDNPGSVAPSPPAASTGPVTGAPGASSGSSSSSGSSPSGASSSGASSAAGSR